MKHKKIIIAVVVTVVLAMCLAFYNMVFINPKRVTVREEVITSSKLPQSFDDFMVVFFSDLHYTTSITKEELSAIVATINSFDPDVILFGGDLVDHYSRNLLDENEESELTSLLKEMKANYGKYAVLGNHDLDSEIIIENVKRILTNADFSVLRNSAVKVRNGGQGYINIVGIDSLMLGEPDVETAYKDVTNENYTIALCHTPDIFDTIPTAKTDLLLAGHSHGGQIYIPFITNYFLPDGAHNYYRGQYYKDATMLDVTNGVGTTKNDLRLFADAEIVVYKFKVN